MAIITIPKKLGQKGDFVVIPRREYEKLLQVQTIPAVKPTPAELRAIARGRKEINQGKYVEWSKFRKELARRSR